MNRVFDKYPFLYSSRFLFWLLVGIVFVATFHRLWLTESAFNNYQIFRWSFFNLKENVNLYDYHPLQHQDLFKYSPTFAALMPPFYFLPTWLGLLSWNLLNVLVPYWAIRQIRISERERALVILFVCIELLSSIQNSQSNGLMAGLMIGAFALLEKGKPIQAALLLCLGFYIKIFAALLGIIFIFYPSKWKFILACAGCLVLLALLPVPFCGLHNLIEQYQNWLHLLSNDPAGELNFSIMTLTQRWFHFTCSDLFYLIPGLLLLVVPLLRISQWKNFSFRLTFLAQTLIWVVLFNHKAESPTYVIAMFGVALWSVFEIASPMKTSLLWFVFIFTGLVATDLFPSVLKQDFFVPYCIKALPCMLVWGILSWQLLKKDYTPKV
jgi:Glycosyltransferase family 87